MDVIKYIKSCILEKDRENLLKTKSIAKRHLDFGHPLVPKFEEKIDEFGIKYKMSRGQILASIVSDDVAATRFAKSASRQRMAEKSQLDYLKGIRRIKIERLKQSGPDSVRIRKGELEYGTPKTVGSTKAIDAFSGNTDFIFLKWTDGSGGGQDNQAMDAVRFLEAAHEYTSKHDDKYRFVAILDGPYFQRHWSVFTDFRSDRVLGENSDSYKRRGRPAAVSATIKPIKKEYKFEIKTN